MRHLCHLCGLVSCLHPACCSLPAGAPSSQRLTLSPPPRKTAGGAPLPWFMPRLLLVLLCHFCYSTAGPYDSFGGGSVAERITLLCGFLAYLPNVLSVLRFTALVCLWTMRDGAPRCYAATVRAAHIPSLLPLPYAGLTRCYSRRWRFGAGSSRRVRAVARCCWCGVSFFTALHLRYRLTMLAPGLFCGSPWHFASRFLLPNTCCGR